MSVDRRTVDLSDYPDLVVIYLGMRVRTVAGLRYLIGLGPEIAGAAAERPDGLLLHENLIMSLVPPHAGMRQYWRDYDSLERWTRSEPHRRWWQQFLKDTRGTGFWHEAYFMSGGMEAVYDGLDAPLGFARFAPVRAARGRMFSARDRARRSGQPVSATVVPEAELYGTATRQRS